MIIDSSVLVAIVLEEPDAWVFVSLISTAENKQISAASLLETYIVVNRKKGQAGLAILQEFLLGGDIRVVNFDEIQARTAFAAHLRFGKGQGHPAQLNILDCCSYALAAATGEPLLFKGNDFTLTDIAVAAP